MNILIRVPSKVRENLCRKVSKCSLIRNIGINISYIFDFTKDDKHLK